MPTLNWIGKSKVVNHHLQVPYCILDRKYSFDENGQSESDSKSENMIIHGDNLVAFKALMSKYQGKIKCIYIDPPYNTGNENWVYNDNVNDPRIKKWLGDVVGKEGEDLSRHDKWLCMMYPRLKLLQKLLADDGCLIISISIHELNYLLMICNEIFSMRQIQLITVKTSGGKPSNGFNISTEYLVFITPENDFNPNSSEEAMNKYSSPYHGMNLATFNQVQRPNQTYPIFVDNNGIFVGVGKSLQKRVEEGLYKGKLEDFKFDYNEAPENCVAIWPVTAKGSPCVWRLIPSRLENDWKKGFIKIVPQKGKNINKYSVQYLSEGIINKIESGELKSYKISDNPLIPTIEVEDFKTGGVGIATIWDNKDYYTTVGSNQITEILGNKGIFNYPKPVNLIQEIINRITDKDSIILDSFAGSGTTAHAVLNANKADGGNRKFILIELMDYAENITAERVKRVIKGYGDGKKSVEGTGGNFSFYELGAPIFKGDELNEAIDIDEIRKYVYFSETRNEIEPMHKDEPYLMGVHCDTAYYFCYEKEKAITLNFDFLSKIKTKASSYVIYADSCTLSEEQLERMFITFKKIPRDILKC